ncbi:MAG: PD-(D/E)XK nuclease family protein [Alphaproteobacteria bacterium]|nr:PD-(D/E)XK nuclease family protein [Alphaproteobacteria bacterium]
MGLNNNIFYATNPARVTDALWGLMKQSGADVADMLIFLPSRRAVRTVEKMIAEKSGGVAILPKLVALGEGVDDDGDDGVDTESAPDVISNVERVVILARLLAADANVGNLSTALTVAHDLVRMQDYLENEGVDAADVDWGALVDDKYATHFQNKAKILSILSSFMDKYANGRITSVAARNRDIRAWINQLDKYKLVVVCASTASVPATADLMVAVAHAPHGRIILSGKIDGRADDFALDTNPYNAEYKFLLRLGMNACDVRPIDVGGSGIDFMNYAFGNDCVAQDVDADLSNCNLITVPRESVEADVVAEIATRAIAEKKSVLVITPDAAGNQRIASALKNRGIVADFSGGVPGGMTAPGRAILNLLDAWIEEKSDVFDKIYAENNNDLFNTIAAIVDLYMTNFQPQFATDDAGAIQIWRALRDVSNALNLAQIKLSMADARAFVADALGGVSVRGEMRDDAQVVVLGTIESRMQTADVVILTGLNEGMFPSRGYENAWLPRASAEKIGLPSPNRKVSLQALDFMNLSCGKCVYWLRSGVAGGVQTAESRFLSRVIARRGRFNLDTDVLGTVLARDKVPHRPLDYSAPMPPADWSDVYVTELEHLIHNPYSFYVRHILRLRVLDDYWVGVDARDFGNLVHDVIEHAVDLRPDVLVAEMDRRALERLGAGSVIFHFWHKRFVEIAPVIANELASVENAYAEIGGCVKIAGRNVRARADRIWDGGVMDVKTGAAPTKSQLAQGNMPQLPLEAYILQQGGFPIKTSVQSRAPIMRFLQLRNNDVRVIEYDSEKTAEMMRTAVEKTTDLFNMYSAGGAAYEYRETNDQKYKNYDDLARVKD